MSNKPDLSFLDDWRAAVAAGKKVVLHIGGGVRGEKLYPRYLTDEWHQIRIDMDEAAKPDLKTDIRQMNALPNGCADAIWTSRTLELLETHQVPTALAECFRVLKMGGEMGACTPDLPAIAAHIAHGRLETQLYKNKDGVAVRPIDLLFGSEAELASGNINLAHRTGLSAESLVSKMRAAGFSNITVVRRELSLWLGSFKVDKSDERFKEKPRILSDKLPEMPPAPPLGRHNHPGMLHAGKLPDELDVPPKHWEMA